MQRAEVRERRWSWESVTESDELVGRISVVSRLPQLRVIESVYSLCELIGRGTCYLTTAMLTWRERSISGRTLEQGLLGAYGGSARCLVHFLVSHGERSVRASAYKPRTRSNDRSEGLSDQFTRTAFYSQAAGLAAKGHVRYSWITIAYTACAGSGRASIVCDFFRPSDASSRGSTFHSHLVPAPWPALQ